ncbi:hypothetical protein ACJX0J_034590, partial [Zea mays]
VQLIRIECRVPEYGWTTQKVFHFLNFLVNGVRSVVFVLGQNVQLVEPKARAMSTDVLRPTFYWINGVVYAIQMIFKNSAHEEELTSQVKGWIRSWDNETINVLDVISNFPDISM